MNAHPVVMFEFIAADQARLCTFYETVFGWEFDRKGPFAYIDFPTPPTFTLGGIGQAQDGVPGWSPGCAFYLAAADLKETLTAVERAGGAVVMTPTEADGYHFAMFTDPEKNLVGLLQTGSST